MPAMLVWAIWILTAYLAGSISFALILGRINGMDIRAYGSGNVGATNLGRALGKKWGVLCFVLDLGKGLVPVLGYRLTLLILDQPPTGAVGLLMWLAVGMAAVLGHVFPIFLGFKGGKGVATSAGALLGFWPVLTVPALISALAWLAVTKATAYVGLASVVAAAVLPVLVVGFALLLGYDAGEVAICGGASAALAALVIVRHRTNIARLRAGTEAKVDWAQKKRPDPKPEE